MLGRFTLAINLLLVAASAQETSEITGRIVDASGAPASGAAIEILQTSTGVKWQVLSNTEGYYTLALLPPSEYRVTVSLPGFKREARTVALEMEQIGRLDFTLEVGAVTETVEVAARAAILESSNASIGQIRHAAYHRPAAQRTQLSRPGEIVHWSHRAVRLWHHRNHRRPHQERRWVHRQRRPLRPE